MPLTAMGCATAGPGKYYDGRGLILVKRSVKSGYWVFRYRLFNRRPEIGLGGYPDVSLGRARSLADDARQLVKAKIDPKQEKRKQSASDNILFKHMAEEAFKAQKASLKGDGTNGRWMSPLTHHVLPKMGGIPVNRIDQTIIYDALSPIWHDKAPTAKKAFNRIGIVMRYASAKVPDIDLQVMDKARVLLGVQRHETKGIVMMPWPDVPAFYRTLVAHQLEDQTTTKLLLRMIILTGIRTKAVRYMNLNQIEGDIWTAPAENLKNLKGKGRDFRVPISAEMRNVMEACKPFMRSDGYLFPGRAKGVLSDVMTSRFMERLNMEARPHGFRKSFRTWLSEATDAPYEVREFCIEHDRRDTVAKVYDQTDYLEKRRPLMERWGRFVTGQGGAKLLKLPSSTG